MVGSLCDIFMTFMAVFFMIFSYVLKHNVSQNEAKS